MVPEDHALGAKQGLNFEGLDVSELLKEVHSNEVCKEMLKHKNLKTAELIQEARDWELLGCLLCKGIQRYFRLQKRQESSATGEGPGGRKTKS